MHADMPGPGLERALFRLHGASSTQGHPLAGKLASLADVTHAAHAVCATYESHVDISVTVRTVGSRDGARNTPERALLDALVALEADARHLADLVRNAVERGAGSQH